MKLRQIARIVTSAQSYPAVEIGIGLTSYQIAQRRCVSTALRGRDDPLHTAEDLHFETLRLAALADLFGVTIPAVWELFTTIATYSPGETPELRKGIEVCDIAAPLRNVQFDIERMKILHYRVMDQEAERNQTGSEEDERDDLADLREWAGDELKGKQRKLIELLADNQKIPGDTIAREMQWEKPWDDSFSSMQTPLNKRLKKLGEGWRIQRKDGEVRLAKNDGAKIT